MSILHLENFAKIKNSDLDIQDITVIAGKPGTGKSYIMKVLYGINDSIRYGHPDNKISFEKLSKLDSNKNDYKKNIFKELPGLYKNILNSIFGDINQINENFSLKLGDINLEYNNSKIEVYHIKEESPAALSPNNIFVETP